MRSSEEMPTRRPNRIPFDRHPIAMVIGAVAIAGVLAVIIVVVGPGGVFHFLFSFLPPMVAAMERYLEPPFGGSP